MIKNFLLFGLIFFVVLGCGKDEPSLTIIKGTVTDRKTGKPIEGALIIIRGKKPGANGLDEYFTQPCPRSDPNGRFSCTLEGDYTSSEIGKDGYISHERFLDVANGQENGIGVSLVPRDGFLRLKIENATGQHDTLYASIRSQTEYVERNGFYNAEATPKYPLPLKHGETYTAIFSLSSPEVIRVQWGFKKPTYQMPHILKDSVMVLPKDTATYILSY